MAQDLKINNYGELNIRESTKLSADSADGASSFTVQNNEDFSANDYFIIGLRGSETMDQLLVLSVSGDDTITSTAAAKRQHFKHDDVTKLFGNKLRIYRASNVNGSRPADGDFALLATQDIDFDQMFTDYTDADGSSSYWYRYSYYNSTALTETEKSRPFRGGNYGNYCSIQEIRQEAGLEGNRWITDERIDLKRQAAQAFINSMLSGLYTLPFSEPINPLIAECTRLLAAGYLLTDNYGPLSTLNTNEGKQKIEQVTNEQGTGILDKLNTKKLTLVGLLGASEAASGTQRFKMWPNADTEDASDTEGGDDGFGFKRRDRY